MATKCHMPSWMPLSIASCMFCTIPAFSLWELPCNCAGNSSQPAHIAQAMLLVGAALPESAVAHWWAPGAWARSVRGAAACVALRRCLACLEAAVRPDRLSVAFCRTPSRVRGAWLPTREPHRLLKTLDVHAALRSGSFLIVLCSIRRFGCYGWCGGEFHTAESKYVQRARWQAQCRLLAVRPRPCCSGGPTHHCPPSHPHHTQLPLAGSQRIPQQTLSRPSLPAWSHPS
jgi:hypothetical protein